MKGTQTSQNQSNNGHRIEIHALSDEGRTFTEKELRDIRQYLEQRGFTGYTDVKRISLFERGLKLFGQ